MSEFKVSIVSSNEEIFSGTADMLYATGSLGEIGIAPGPGAIPISPRDPVA